MQVQQQFLQPQSPIAIGHKATLRKLGIAETVIGFIFFLVQIIVISVYSTQYGTTNQTSTYTGFIDSALIVIAGCLAIASGGKNATTCLINTHMGFAIVAAILCMCSFGYGVVVLPSLFAVIGTPDLSDHDQQSIIVLDVILLLCTALSFISFVLFVVSATYCCKTTSALGYGSCCGGCCGEAPLTYTTVNVTHTTQVPPQGYPQQPTLQLNQRQGGNHGYEPPKYEEQTPVFEALPDDLPLKA